MILDRFRLDGRVALVTGSGRGIGRGIALALAEAGADVVCAARSPDQIADTAAQIRALGRHAIAIPCDVMRTEDLDALADRSLDELGRLDVLVNNAGGTPPRPALQTSERFFEVAFRFNVIQAFLLTQRCVPKMVESAGGGAVVNISSRAGGLVQRGFAAYGTSKMGLNFLTKILAAEFAPKVRVNAIAVGGVATEALEVVVKNDALRTQLESKTPMKRIGEVEDIAACALYLASPAASWITGKIFEVDGGAESPALEVPTPPL
jgi:7-alpha-hydroxysteroid dehydrogenase